MEGTAADRGARRVDTGHTRTVCSGTIADPFFHVGPDSSHNTSKVTKAEGKQIRGRALTGLLNTHAPRRWSPSLLKVATTRPADEDDDGDVDADAAWPSSRAQACIASCVLAPVPPCQEGQKRPYSCTYARRKRSLLEVGKNGREGGVKQHSGKPSFLLSGRAEPRESDFRFLATA